MCKTYELKMNNLLVDVEIFSLAINKLYFKRSSINISRNCDALFSQIDFDQAYFVSGGFLAWRVLSGGLCPETVILS